MFFFTFFSRITDAVSPRYTCRLQRQANDYWERATSAGHKADVLASKVLVMAAHHRTVAEWEFKGVENGGDSTPPGPMAQETCKKVSSGFEGEVTLVPQLKY